MEYYSEVLPLIIKADQIIKNLFFSVTPLYNKDFPEGQDVTIPLFTTLHTFSESILVLLQNYALFEADILLRCVMEGTVKYCFLMNGTSEERKEKYKEYKTVLTEISKLEDHQKAVETINILKEFSDNSTIPFEASVLPDEIFQALKQKYPATTKNKFKRKWSYQNLLKELAKTQTEYEAQLGSISTYALTSHFTHFDWTGVSSMQEQIASSPNNENVPFDVGHAVRIISNIVCFSVFRLMEYTRGNNFSSPETLKFSLEAIEFINNLDQRNNQILSRMNE